MPLGWSLLALAKGVGKVSLRQDLLSGPITIRPASLGAVRSALSEYKVRRYPYQQHDMGKVQFFCLFVRLAPLPHFTESTYDSDLHTSETRPAVFSPLHTVAEP